MDKKILYVSDLDGTLLNTKECISKKSLTIINDLIAKGMCFTYATARSLVSSSKVSEGLNKHIPVIVYNGAFIMEADTKKIIYSCFFQEEEQAYVKMTLKKCNLYPIVYTFIDGVERVLHYKVHENEGMKRYLENRKEDPRMQALQLNENIYQGDIFYYTCIGEKEELQLAYDAFKKDERFTCTFQQELYQEEYWLEIMPKQATKANAIKHLKQLWDCNYVISFGDAINDIAMFEVSDECYAVENAVNELKKLATKVIASNDQDGVALWLQENTE